MALAGSRRRAGIPAILAVVLSSGCSDGPVAPEGPRFTTYTIEGLEVNGCQYGGEYPYCNPAPSGGEQEASVCSPWMELCGGMQNPGYMGSGGAGTSTESSGDVPPAGADDSVGELAPPDCDPLPTRDQEEAYCRGVVPDSVRAQKIRDALARIAARGEVCRRLAEAGERLLAQGRIRIFSLGDLTWNHPVSGRPEPWFSGAAPQDGDWLVLEDRWTDLWATTVTMHGSQPRNLEHTLAHELDHHLNHASAQTNGVGHLRNPDGTTDPVNTANSKQCSGLP